MFALAVLGTLVTNPWALAAVVVRWARGRHEARGVAPTTTTGGVDDEGVARRDRD